MLNTERIFANPREVNLPRIGHTGELTTTRGGLTAFRPLRRTTMGRAVDDSARGHHGWLRASSVQAPDPIPSLGRRQRINGGFRCALTPAGNSDGGELDEVRRKGRGARFIARGSPSMAPATTTAISACIPSSADFERARGSRPRPIRSAGSDSRGGEVLARIRGRRRTWPSGPTTSDTRRENVEWKYGRSIRGCDV
jgi:hypothetical protein